MSILKQTVRLERKVHGLFLDEELIYSLLGIFYAIDIEYVKVLVGSGGRHPDS